MQWGPHELIADESAWRVVAFVCSTVSIGLIAAATVWLYAGVQLRRRALSAALGTLQAHHGTPVHQNQPVPEEEEVPGPEEPGPEDDGRLTDPLLPGSGPSLEAGNGGSDD